MFLYPVLCNDNKVNSAILLTTIMSNFNVALKGNTLLTTYTTVFADQQTTMHGSIACCESHLFLHAV